MQATSARVSRLINRGGGQFEEARFPKVVGLRFRALLFFPSVRFHKGADAEITQHWLSIVTPPEAKREGGWKCGLSAGPRFFPSSIRCALSCRAPLLCGIESRRLRSQTKWQSVVQRGDEKRRVCWFCACQIFVLRAVL